jgi:hypothetical protein
MLGMGANVGSSDCICQSKGAADLLRGDDQISGTKDNYYSIIS